jgi:hypothetical protein
MRCTALGLAAATAVVVMACDQPRVSEPADSQDPISAVVTSTACLFTGNPSLSKAASTYFTLKAEQDTASDLITQIQTAYNASPRNTAVAKDKTYDLLALVGRASRRGNGSSADDGEDLVKLAINCGFSQDLGNVNEFPDYPNGDRWDFSKALTPLAGGAFYVRGGANDPNTGPVIGNVAGANGVVTAAGNISGLIPPAGLNWRNSTTPPAARDGILDQRVLIYGEPTLDGMSISGYDWKLVSRNTQFTPRAVVALCPAANGGQAYNDDDMVHQEGVGVIGFQDDGSTICGTIRPIAMDGGRAGFGVINRLVEFARAAFSAEPLSAAVATTNLTGGVRGAKGDKFNDQTVSTVKLEFTEDMPKTKIKVNTGRFNLTVKVSTPPEPVGGEEISLQFFNNNGTPTNVYQVIDPTVTNCTLAAGKVIPVPTLTTEVTVGIGGTNPVTAVRWTNLCGTKTGAIVAHAIADAAARTGGIGSVNSAKGSFTP